MIRRLAKRILPRPIRQLSRAAIWSISDVFGHHGVPPAYLRLKVCGSLDIPSFVLSGEENAKALLLILQQVGVKPDECSTVLDFGCGAGRTVSRLQPKLPRAKIYGTDTDAGAIRWCQKNLSALANFDVNAPAPPLKYADGQFDVINSWSVFTHLDEELQFRWLEELRRISKPGAILLLSIHASPEEDWPPEHDFAKRGFHFERSTAWSDFFPEFYQHAVHSKNYIEKHWSSYFTILDYVAQGGQVIVVLRKEQ